MLHTNWCWPYWLNKAPCEFKACKQHDLSYFNWWTKIDRWVADQNFLDWMLEESSNVFCPYIYYYLVRLFGRFYFNYK